MHRQDALLLMVGHRRLVSVRCLEKRGIQQFFVRVLRWKQRRILREVCPGWQEGVDVARQHWRLLSAESV